jgi:8-oxo-dGTP diphosphatase
LSGRVVRVVAGLIADPADPGRYLVQQRLPTAKRALLWEFPGGKVEAGESDAQALARECREELGVELQIGSELWRTHHAYEDLTVELVLLRAALRAGFPLPLGAHDLRFVRPEQMSALPFCEADLPLIARLAQGEWVGG